MAVQDMTRGNPFKIIFWFTIPLIVGNIFQQVYNFADTLIVGRTLGITALASVGSTAPISWLALGFIQGITVGFSVVTSQYFGANKIDEVKKSVATSIYLCIITAIFITIISAFFTMPLLKILNTPDDIIDDAYAYLNIILLGSFANIYYNMVANVIRSIGDSKTPLIFLTVAMVMNIILDILFIVVFKTGVAGAAYATVISQFMSGLLCTIYIKYRLPILHLDKSHFKIDKKSMLKHLNIGFPMGFQKSILTIGLLTVQSVLNSFGSVAVAAFTTASKIEKISGQAIITIGTSSAVYTAQNFGAKKFRRIRNGLNKCFIMAFCFSIISAVIVFVFGNSLIDIFIVGDYPEIVDLAKKYLVIVIPFYFFIGALFILRSTLQGMGYSFFTMWSGFIELFMRIFAALVLGDYFGFEGVCFASPAAWVGASVFLFIGYIIKIKKATHTAKSKIRLSVEKILSISQTTPS